MDLDSVEGNRIAFRESRRVDGNHLILLKMICEEAIKNMLEMFSANHFRVKGDRVPFTLVLSLSKCNTVFVHEIGSLYPYLYSLLMYRNL